MIREVVHAFRTIIRMPVLAVVVVISIAVGIGVNTAVFSWVQALVLRPIPGVQNAGEFHALEPRAETGSYPGMSWLEYRDVRERLGSFTDLLAFRPAPFNVGERGREERTFGLLVSGNYFSVLDLHPALGRLIVPDEASRPGGEPVVVLGYDYWQTRFGGSADAIGRRIRVNEVPLTVVGIAPRRFQGTVISLNFDLWMPATLAPTLLAGSRELEDRSLRGYSVIGRLRPGVSRQRAQADFDAVMNALGLTFPETNGKIRGEVVPFWQATRGPQRTLASAVLMLQTVMLLLLLAVCGNTANLMLARAGSRQREIGVRLAMGAGPWRIAATMLTENVVLALIGAGLGVLIAIWATEAMRAVPIIGAFPIRFQTNLDAISLAFAALLGIACGLGFGIAPAAYLSRLDPLVALRAGIRTAARSGLRNALMAAEVALALIVLIVAALFFRSFNESRELDPGFRREGVLLAAYDFSGRNPDAAATREFTRRLLERLRALPSVESAAIALSVPLDIHGLPLRSFILEGRVKSEPAPDRALTNMVTPGYFRTMDVAMVAGTDFAPLSDTTAPAQAVVNEEFVRRFVGGGEVLGRRITSRGTSYAIAGVVRNSVSDAFGEQTPPVIYLAYRDRPTSRGEIHARTRAGAELLLAPQIEQVVRELDPSLPVYDIRTLSEHIEKNLFFRRVPARIFVVLGPALLLLAALGIYAVVAYTVAHRTTEIGIRLALGATRRRVVRQIVAETLRVIAAGAVFGWIFTVLINLHLVRGPLYLSVFAGVPAILLLVAAAACWLPAWRASRLDPVEALREN
jgi:putative ABC transport system permease protein